MSSKQRKKARRKERRAGGGDHAVNDDLLTAEEIVALSKVGDFSSDPGVCAITLACVGEYGDGMQLEFAANKLWEDGEATLEAFRVMLCGKDNDTWHYVTLGLTNLHRQQVAGCTQRYAHCVE